MPIVSGDTGAESAMRSPTVDGVEEENVTVNRTFDRLLINFVAWASSL